ncbi:MAG: ATP-dependent RecD-like DNA helicase [Clostridiales bacterium]|jgi:exodeoxyribonuclease V alpha subunit|nr:ATP-dependent RecD-like DNA helicase [Clostridiales bacterium]
MQENEKDKTEELRGGVEGITFRKEDTGFTVLELNSGGELVTVVGVFSQINEGEEVCLKGHWDFHRTFGRQFRAELCEWKLPSTAGDLLKYLSSGVIKGVGPSTALKIVEKFGDESFEVLENEPRRLARIRGISLAKAEAISARFKEQFAAREVMISLERFGMTASECLKAFKLFGRDASETIKLNPYILCGESVGIGFERADAIAAAMPERPDNIFRTMAGIVHIIRHNLSNGHTCVPREKIYEPSLALTGVGKAEADEAIEQLVSGKRLISSKLEGREFLFLPHIFNAEKDAADHIKAILRFPPPTMSTLDEEIKLAEKKNNIVYEEKQRLAVKTAVEKGLLILTGGPGTGKTTALKGIISLFEQQGLDIALAAPTGRAAKRMSDVTGREAKTIHRFLEVEWDESDRPVFQRNERNPIEANAVILDELSMVDIYVFSSLLKALPIGCRLVMVGDSDQLPPVGAGNVLADMISSGLLPTVQLTEVFRQSMESLIVSNAHSIVRGEMPELNVKDRDFFFMEREVCDTAETIAELCSSRLPKAYGYSSLDDIQVLCPSRKGGAGTACINRALQERLNPRGASKKEADIRGTLFREGDKVMQIKNNYNICWEKENESGTGVFNGDIGILKAIDTKKGMLVVDFDGRVADYPLESALELELAYAITVHKSQGNEFEAVIMSAVGVARQLLYRNLLYTAVTRARSMMIIVGCRGQISAMTKNDKKSKRYSALKSFLTEQYE